MFNSMCHIIRKSAQYRIYKIVASTTMTIIHISSVVNEAIKKYKKNIYN